MSIVNSTRVLEDLEKGDVLFVDSSHHLLMGSDVAVISMGILPRLKPGVVALAGILFLSMPFLFREFRDGCRKIYLEVSRRLTGKDPLPPSDSVAPQSIR